MRIAKELAANDGRIAHGVYDAVNFGAPQNRQRLIIATPTIIKRLNESPISQRVSVRDAFAREGITIPKESTHIKNTSRITDGTALRPITGHSFTCCAARALSWCTAAGDTVQSMKPQHTRVLMGLPQGFALSGKQRIDQRVLGNGVVYGLAKAIALAAMGRPIPPASPVTATEASRLAVEQRVPPLSSAHNKRKVHFPCMCEELETRVVRLERKLLKLLSSSKRPRRASD